VDEQADGRREASLQLETLGVASLYNTNRAVERESMPRHVDKHNGEVHRLCAATSMPRLCSGWSRHDRTRRTRCSSAIRHERNCDLQQPLHSISFLAGECTALYVVRLPWPGCRNLATAVGVIKRTSGELSRIVRALKCLIPAVHVLGTPSHVHAEHVHSESLEVCHIESTASPVRMERSGLR